MDIKPEILEKIGLLEKKYQSMGQDISSYLDGTLYADYLTYWDYIHLDTLLTLQSPRTSFPDEKIFIIYHQITELYFKLILCEIEQIYLENNVSTDFFIEKLSRINRYWDNLVASFDVMVDGMDQKQFLKFRMSLLPASGFQSAQYRIIEICCTDMIRLVSIDKRDQFGPTSALKDMYEEIYWKAGAIELSSGNKTLTLRQFEKKYAHSLLSYAEKYQFKNLRSIHQTLKKEGKSSSKMEDCLRLLDLSVNVNWPLAHYKSAVKYLQMDPEDIAATGGTNWQKYLPPRFQKRIFYPELWTEAQINEWGKSWIIKNIPKT